MYQPGRHRKVQYTKKICIVVLIVCLLFCILVYSLLMELALLELETLYVIHASYLIIYYHCVSMLQLKNVS